MAANPNIDASGKNWEKTVTDGLRAVKAISAAACQVLRDIYAEAVDENGTEHTAAFKRLQAADPRDLKVEVIGLVQNLVRTTSFQDQFGTGDLRELRRNLILFSEVCLSLLQVSDLESRMKSLIIRTDEISKHLRSWLPPQHSGIVSINGYTLEVTDTSIAPLGNYEEILQEWLAACWISLYYLYTRLDNLWSEVLYLSDRMTHGLASGVAVYKAYGDVYRITHEDLKQFKEIGINFLETDCRIRSIVHSPVLFTGADIVPKLCRAEDLNPPFVRSLGATYYALQLMAYMRSGFPLTILWRYNSLKEIAKEINEKLLAWLRFVGGNDCKTMWSQLQSWPDTEAKGGLKWVYVEDGHKMLTGARWAIWVAPSSIFEKGELPLSIVGLRRGVYTIRSGIHMPYSSRELSQGLRDSFMQGLRYMASEVRDYLYKFDPQGFTLDSRVYAEKAGFSIISESGKEPDRKEVETALVWAAAVRAKANEEDPGEEGAKLCDKLAAFDLGRLFCEYERKAPPQNGADPATAKQEDAQVKVSD